MADERISRSGGGSQRGVGADASPQLRPGVPMYARGVRPPDARARTELARQRDQEDHLKRLGLKRLTPVYGTANPLHGLAGAMRRWAYAYPENLARHWMVLMLADRVDVVEDRLGGVLERPFKSVGLDGLGRRVRRNPFAAVAVVAGAGWLVTRMLRSDDDERWTSG